MKNSIFSHDNNKNKYDIIQKIIDDPVFKNSITRVHHVPAQAGSYSPLPADLSPLLKEALSGAGISSLYSHQALTYELARKKRHFVVVTPTASGKTLCYNLPVLQSLLEKPEGRALYLFPTKALSQDQQSGLNQVILQNHNTVFPIPVFTFDGDTPSSLRMAARDTGRIIITNPDMLHTGILPNHPKWIKFISNLQYVVIDEIHTYRGIFGSHTANVVRRLKRIAAYYGSNPVFICCSATIANPRELAQTVTGCSMQLVNENGAPRGEKQLVFYNPPLVDHIQGIRKGVVNESKGIAVKLLKGGIKTIVFARSRIRVELIAAYINKALKNHFCEDHRIQVESYRGGYLPQERRAIEKGLREGIISGVVATNALELGIDIGTLDAAVLAGFPGSIASVWQQAGRAGRRNSLSVAFIIASAAPTDQYLVKHPDYFLGKNPESGRINPDNPFILLDHLKCALFELPFTLGETFGNSGQANNNVDEALAFLEEEGVARFTGGSFYWAHRSYPAEEVNLRNGSGENVVIINTTQGRYEVIGEMDLPSAKELLFDGAVYIHRGDQYMCEHLDVENRKCLVKEADVNFYTDSIVKSDIKVLYEDVEHDYTKIRIVLGDVLVRRQVTKYKKLKYATHENIGYGDIHLPEDEIHTRSIMLVLTPSSVTGKVFKAVTEEYKEEVLARTATVLRMVAPVFLLCDVSDLGVAERLRDPHTRLPTLYFYDMCPGGVGLVEGFAEALDAIISGGLELLSRCGCTQGCPSCIGPAGKGVKIETLKLLSAWHSG